MTTKAKDFDAIDPSFRVDQEQDTIFSSEIFTPGADGETRGQSAIELSSEGVTAAVHSIEGQKPEKDLNGRLAQLDERIDRFSEQLNKLDANFKLINARLDSLDQRVDSVAVTKLPANESQPITPAAAGPNVTDLVSKIESRFESLESIFKAQSEKVNGFFASTNSNGEKSAEATTNSIVEPESCPTTAPVPIVEAEPTPPVEKAPFAHWQEQKQAMMAKYEFDSEMTESWVATPTESNTDKPQTATPETSKPTTSAEEASVDELKRELNSKIREAEVEMSINRARLMQERVEFERAQAELERRAATLEAKLAARRGNQKNDDIQEAPPTGTDSGLMGRFKRHLGNQ